MEIYLDKVDVDKKSILYRLLEYSLFEESLTDLNEMNDNALFPYEGFDEYFDNENKTAYFIREKDSDKLLGFVMISKDTQKMITNYSIVEFMIIPKYRKKGLGALVVRECFNKYKGNFRISPSYNSDSAYHFWKKVIKEYTNDNYQYEDGVFVFKT